ncbi:PD-(D/E)XK nuclease-like domain-containing protein [Candidatus Pacearchaeota archaeon]|nr:PD-(D/E)XK nuclease-like domain-containing protein [Candidatus Pacearchaeota archaeon]
MKTISEQIIHLKPEDLKDFVPEMGKIYSGLPNEQYHSFKDSESSTTVKPLLITIKHWLDMVFKSTDAMAFGILFHDSMEALRTGQDLSEFSRVIDSFGRSKKSDAAEFILKYYPLVHGREYDQDLEEMTAKSVSRESLHTVADDLERLFMDGRRKVTTEDFERSQKMVEAIRDNPVTKRLIGYYGDAELSFFCEVEIEIDGKTHLVKVRVRPDDLIEFEDEVWVDDWKSIGDIATDKNIRMACWKWRYDIQGAMYFDVVSHFTAKPVKFRLIFAESNMPAKEKVRVEQLSEYDMDEGWKDYRKALKNKALYLQDKTIWTGYDIPDDGIGTISMRRKPAF